MIPPRKENLGKGDGTGDADCPDPPLGGYAADESGEMDGSRSRGISGGLSERLRDSLGDDGDADLLLDRSDVENCVLPWLRALDSQVLGACRADERLNPLLKINVSSGVAEDLLLTQLRQHFEASEIGMLVRCLCVPLVSIRVGKVEKQGNLLCPTSTRGHLNLTLLPSSTMRVSFSGDDGHDERLALVQKKSESSGIAIEEITADGSGRSFLLSLPGSHVLYFWCSEKSKLQGMQLLTKMRDLLRRKPSLSQLTGISESRLDSFAAHLHAYFHGLPDIDDVTNSTNTAVGAPISASSARHSGCDSNPSSSAVSKSSRFRLGVAHTAKVHFSYQGSLSPKSNTFKDGQPRGSSFTRNGTREKLRRRGDGHTSLSDTNGWLVASASSSQTTHVSQQIEDENLLEGPAMFDSVKYSLSDMPCLSLPVAFLGPSALHLPHSRDPISSSQFCPYYCWCPPCPPSLCSVANPHLPSTAMESMPLPPFSSLLSAASPAKLVPSRPPSGVAQLPALNLANLHEPVVPLPLPVSSLVTMPGSQQIPTFTPLMSDPIVHVPIIDVCSSGQGYLVSAGPAIPTAIPPLLPKVMNHSISNSESALEESARETLRMLIASTPIPTASHISVLPAVFGKVDNTLTFCHENSQLGLPAGSSKALYCVSEDVGAVAKALASIDLSCFVVHAADSGTSDGYEFTVEAAEDHKLTSDGEEDLSSG